MSRIEISTDDVIEAFCKLFERHIKKNVLQVACNKYGVDVQYKKSDPSLIMLHFITIDMLEIEVIIDLMELQQRGKEYIDHVFGLYLHQAEEARRVRQEENSIVIHTGSYAHKQSIKEPEKKSEPLFKEKPLTLAHNKAIDNDGTIH